MTFIVAVSNDEVAIHVADTLLTNPDGSFHADELVKTTIVHCRDAKLLLSYTGLAILDSTRTDKWLVACLRKFNAPTKVFNEIVQFITKCLNESLSRNPALRSAGLTLVINGLGLSPSGEHQQAIALVSNRHKPIPKRNDFAEVDPKNTPFSSFFRSPPTWYMAVHGAVSEQLNIGGHRRKIIEDLKAVNTQDEMKKLLDSLVAMLRLQRTDPKLGKLIGDDCTAVAISKDYKSFSYFYSRNSTVQRFPNIVRPEGTIEDFEISH